MKLKFQKQSTIMVSLTQRKANSSLINFNKGRNGKTENLLNLETLTRMLLTTSHLPNLEWAVLTLILNNWLK